MTQVMEFTREAFMEFLAEEFDGSGREFIETRNLINRWLHRGDGAAVYRNEDFSSPDLGHVQIVSFGSPEAQIESADAPDTLPDIGGRINWRYRLHAFYRGEQL